MEHKARTLSLRRLRCCANGWRAARRNGHRRSPAFPPIRSADHLRARIERYFDPLPPWHPPLEHDTTDHERFPLAAITQRPMAMYHSWDSQNAWLRQIHGENYLYMNPRVAAAQGIEGGGWIYVESQWGKVRCLARYSEAVEPGTVWTWNAIGNSAGAWNPGPDANESRRGFLLNHVITDEIPVSGPGDRRMLPQFAPMPSAMPGVVGVSGEHVRLWRRACVCGICARGWRRRGGRERSAVCLHGDDLSVSALSAGVSDTADARQFRLAGLRVGLHPRDGLRRSARDDTRAGTVCCCVRADASRLRVAECVVGSQRTA
jgi:hypothetical protein